MDEIPNMLSVTLDDVRALARNDATVRAWMTAAEIGAVPEVLMLRAMVISLAREKARFFEMACDAEALAMPSTGRAQGFRDSVARRFRNLDAYEAAELVSRGLIADASDPPKQK